jgi:GNAT superfamily N-acetyltransferase
MSLRLLAPQPLTARHLIDGFDCGVSSLNVWLEHRALPNQLAGATRAFVVETAEGRVAGYYALAAGAVSRSAATPKVRKNIPDPVPVLVLARLAVDRGMQGRQLGGALLQDAVKRAVSVSQNTGVRALLMHALDDGAKAFYLHYGFGESPLHPLTLMLPLHAG